ncbi:sugar transporter [Catenovulum agarivorans DS-2]|uniref:Sugar transporter n=1 Tax=Catenovulum agarivorans DS-2 TaxID=1328313 RepID=W7QL28_9ALTE|nr:hypothetical protein [Catenovulum agarivorans]EWH08833.1 sugar transporter [Catenovulum agarivorans DS-2]
MILAISQTSLIVISILGALISALIGLIVNLQAQRIDRSNVLLVGSAGLGFCLLGVVFAFIQTSIAQIEDLNYQQWGLLALIHILMLVVFLNLIWSPLVWARINKAFKNWSRAASTLYFVGLQCLVNLLALFSLITILLASEIIAKTQ